MTVPVVLVSHAEGQKDEDIAGQLAELLRGKGYQAVPVNGASTFRSHLDGAVVLCGTLKSRETGHMERVLEQALVNPRIHIYFAQMERDARPPAYFSGSIFHFWVNPESAAENLSYSLGKDFPAAGDLSIVRNKVFISYSRSDAKWLERLRIHLKPLERQKTIVTFDDTMIDPGAKWRKEIEQALRQTKIAVLLISADFLASEFIAENELPRLLAAAEDDGAKIFSLIVSPSMFEQTPCISQFQTINPPNQPLIGMKKHRQEAVFVKLTETIKKVLSEQ